VATDLGILEPGEDGELSLVAVVADGPEEQQAAVDRAVAACGWPLRVADEVERLPPATAEEMAELRLLDPARRLLG
jgi:acyl CoA:acetate/3-ketoacid CoA transferase beta subunit